MPLLQNQGQQKKEDAIAQSWHYEKKPEYSKYA